MNKERKLATLAYIETHPGCPTDEVRKAINCPRSFLYTLKAQGLIFNKKINGSLRWYLEKKVEVIVEKERHVDWEDQCRLFDSLIHDVVARRAA